MEESLTLWADGIWLSLVVPKDDLLDLKRSERVVVVNLCGKLLDLIGGREIGDKSASGD